MHQDPVYQRLREIGWRRPLAAAEQAELRAWLDEHPEAQAEVEGDKILNAALVELPDAPMPSNFTARVLQALEREAAPAARSVPPHSTRWWRVFLPRFAVAALLVVGVGLFYHHYITDQQQKLADVARQVAIAESLADPVVMADFEVIASLTPPMAVADEKLLALSEDLLALGQ